MDPKRPHIRELLTEDLWERFLTAIASLEQRERRIEELTTQIEALRRALRAARREEA
jgi:DNA-binding winged helix-turn-helix (wHTH) protein